MNSWWPLDSPDAYSNINKVVKLSLTLPLSGAACEKGFSQHNKKQVQISSVTCSSLSPDAHSPVKADHKIFDPKQAVDLWSGWKQLIGESTEDREMHLQHLHHLQHHHHLPCRKLKQRTVGATLRRTVRKIALIKTTLHME